MSEFYRSVNRPSILVLASQLYAPRGIQTYLRRLWEIVSAYGEHRNCRVQCLSLSDSAEEEGFHMHPVRSEHFSACHWNKALFLVRTLRFVQSFQESLLVLGHIRQAPLAWALKRLGLIRGCVFVTYGIEAWEQVGWLQRKAVRDAACIVSISQYTARRFSEENGIPIQRFRIIPPALAEDRLDGMEAFSRSDGYGLKVLTVGRLSRDDRLKGVDTLIQAVGKVSKGGTEVQLVVVGEGDDLPRLKELTEDLGCSPQVSFPGAVPEVQLNRLYRECDLFAMPSQKEGFGIVFLEAMRFGKLCIGGRFGGTPEVISHGVDGLLVEPGDVEQLAGYLVDLSRDSKIRQEMGKAAFEKVRSRHLFPHMSSSWFSLLDELLFVKEAL